MYLGFEKGAASRRCAGFFGELVLATYSGLAIEDEGRLNNYSIREHFLIKLFTLSRFRQMMKQPTLGKLVQFQTTNKMLLLAYNQSQLRIMGKLVGNIEKRDLPDVLSEYRACLHRALARPMKTSSMINVLQHMFGGMSENLTQEDKKLFMNSLEEYRDERIPLSALIYLIKSWATHFNNDYVLQQSLIRPFPVELVSVADSGKGRPLR